MQRDERTVTDECDGDDERYRRDYSDGGGLPMWGFAPVPMLKVIL